MPTTVAEAGDNGMDEATLATLRQIVMLRNREVRLAETREQAEVQMLHRLGVAHQTGQITDLQLFAAYDAYRALAIPGRSTRWNTYIGIPWQRINQERRWKPNGPEGTWVGPWPLVLNDAAPIGGTPVVYILFDAMNEPCYVGSTAGLRARLKRHSKDGKVFTAWQAYACADRESAFQLEVRLLKEKFPRLNQRVGR